MYNRVVYYRRSGNYFGFGRATDIWHHADILGWDIGVWAPKIIKLVLCWGGVGGCGELFWTGILGGRRGGGVLKLRCEHQKL